MTWLPLIVKNVPRETLGSLGLIVATSNSGFAFAVVALCAAATKGIDAETK
jgi:hypothetical protein